ncbi:MAG: hypothetical protein QOH68_4254 [Nocardioidaceae bacterium]|nr:hypothetical protein [Nocardioidaceae bacterium]
MQRLEVVRGRLTDALADEILAFWSAHGALVEEVGRQRLPEVVCVLRDGGGELVGVSSVYADAVPLVGNRRFFVYRRFLAPGRSDEDDERMLVAAFDALDREGAPTGAPGGLCVFVDDPETMRRHPEAVWPDTEMLYAGYLPDGRQVRIRYFADAHIL